MAPKTAVVKNPIRSGSKKKKREDSSDDDFKTVLPAKRKNKTDGSRKENAVELNENEYEETICRCSPDLLIKALSVMNSKQKRAIYDMGFANLYHIGVNEIPGKFAQWCLSVFEPVSSSMLLPHDKRLHISEEDVWLSLGIPRGNRKIISKAKRIRSPMLDEWVANVGKPKNSIKMKDVQVAMNSDSEGGVWFKRHFLVLVEACLFEHASDGYIKPKILENLADLSIVRELNWCEYMMKQLFIHHESWKSNNNNVFTGPILFLIIVYVDRIVYYQRHVERVFPLVKGWDSNILRIRMRKEIADGGMGLGYLDARFNPTLQLRGCANEFGEAVTGGDEESEKEIDEVASYTNKLLSTTATLADSMASLMLLIKEAPNEVRSRREWTECMAKVSDVLHKGEELNSTLGYPTFSMGLTQNPLFNREFHEDFGNGEQSKDSPVKGDETTGKDSDDGTQAVSMTTFAPPSENMGGDQVESGAVSVGGLDDNIPKNNGDMIQGDIDMVVFDSAKDNVPDPGLNTPCTLTPVQIDMGINTFDEIIKIATKSACGPNESNIADDTIRHVVKDLNATMFSTEEPIQNEKAAEGSYGEKKGEENIDILQNTKEDVGPRPAEAVDKGKGKENIIPNAKKPCKKIKCNPQAKQQALNTLTMKTRTRNEKKKAATLLSPFNTRAVDPSDKLDFLEKEIYYWILTDTTVQDDATLYDDDIATLLRSDLNTLKPCSHISTKVINAWSSYLNWAENYKSVDSPSRFFFTTFPSNFPLVQTPAGLNGLQLRKMFFDRVDREVEKVRGFKLQTFDMVFFPICQSMHFYVVCINIRKNHAVILDNSNAMVDEDLSVKYGDVPMKILRFFREYMHGRKFGTKARKLASAPLERLRMPWQNELNKTDCGVYVMRHMETYMGTSVKDWNTGLKQRSKKQMRFLRAKYCAAIMSGEYNDHNVDNIEAARNHYIKSSTIGVVDVEKFIMNYHPPSVEQPAQSEQLV